MFCLRCAILNRPIAGNGLQSRAGEAHSTDEHESGGDVQNRDEQVPEDLNGEQSPRRPSIQAAWVVLAHQNEERNENKEVISKGNRIK